MNRLRRHATTFHGQRGFTLVEALVALVVLSIGMLGIAALYVESLRTARSAVIRSQAVVLAGDMADRIRANRLADGAYTKPTNDAGTTNANCQEGGSSASCVPVVMAEHDKAVWHTELQRLLPMGTGEVTAVAVAGGGGLFNYIITVSWIETGQALPVSYVLRIQA